MIEVLKTSKSTGVVKDPCTPSGRAARGSLSVIRQPGNPEILAWRIMKATPAPMEGELLRLARPRGWPEKRINSLIHRLTRLANPCTARTTAPPPQGGDGDFEEVGFYNPLAMNASWLAYLQDFRGNEPAAAWPTAMTDDVLPVLRSQSGPAILAWRAREPQFEEAPVAVPSAATLTRHHELLWRLQMVRITATIKEGIHDADFWHRKLVTWMDTEQWSSTTHKLVEKDASLVKKVLGKRKNRGFLWWSPEDRADYVVRVALSHDTLQEFREADPNVSTSVVEYLAVVTKECAIPRLPSLTLLNDQNGRREKKEGKKGKKGKKPSKAEADKRNQLAREQAEQNAGEVRCLFPILKDAVISIAARGQPDVALKHPYTKHQLVRFLRACWEAAGADEVTVRRLHAVSTDAEVIDFVVKTALAPVHRVEDLETSMVFEKEVQEKLKAVAPPSAHRPAMAPVPRRPAADHQGLRQAASRAFPKGSTYELACLYVWVRDKFDTAPSCGQCEADIALPGLGCELIVPPRKGGKCEEGNVRLLCGPATRSLTASTPGRTVGMTMHGCALDSTQVSLHVLQRRGSLCKAPFGPSICTAGHFEYASPRRKAA